MASDSEAEAWQPSTDAQALAQLRTLIRAYIRGELSHRAFVLQFGVMSLTHDVATPRPPGKLPRHSYCEDPDCDGHEIGDLSVIPVHTDGCGCAWCSSDYIGPYRGHPAGEEVPAPDKAED